MYFPVLVSFLLCLVLASEGSDISFDQNYVLTWGFDHVLSLNQGTEMQLSMDRSSEMQGWWLLFLCIISSFCFLVGAGFASKLSYGSGFFHLRMKLPDRDSAGVVTAFYLTSQGSNHDELDFEFLGNREGKPYTLQTNVFANGQGNREQRILLWFDPTADFHTYQILWNERQIVFFVDSTPIRVFKSNSKVGVDYPSRPMRLTASLWNGESWATDGGRTKTNWSYAPFKAYFQGFDVSGCEAQNSSVQQCYSSDDWWNTKKYWSLDPGQQSAYENVRKKYMNYDYCSDRPRYPTPPPECLQQ